MDLQSSLHASIISGEYVLFCNIISQTKCKYAKLYDLSCVMALLNKYQPTWILPFVQQLMTGDVVYSSSLCIIQSVISYPKELVIEIMTFLESVTNHNYMYYYFAKYHPDYVLDFIVLDHQYPFMVVGLLEINRYDVITEIFKKVSHKAIAYITHHVDVLNFIVVNRHINAYIFLTKSADVPYEAFLANSKSIIVYEGSVGLFDEICKQTNEYTSFSLLPFVLCKIINEYADNHIENISRFDVSKTNMYDFYKIALARGSVNYEYIAELCLDVYPDIVSAVESKLVVEQQIQCNDKDFLQRNFGIITLQSKKRKKMSKLAYSLYTILYHFAEGTLHPNINAFDNMTLHNIICKTTYQRVSYASRYCLILKVSRIITDEVKSVMELESTFFTPSLYPVFLLCCGVIMTNNLFYLSNNDLKKFLTCYGYINHSVDIFDMHNTHSFLKHAVTELASNHIQQLNVDWEDCGTNII